MCTHTRIHRRIYKFPRIHINSHIYTHTHTYTHTYIHVHSHVHIYTEICTRTHSQAYTYVCTHSRTCTHTYIYTLTHTIWTSMLILVVSVSAEGRNQKGGHSPLQGWAREFSQVPWVHSQRPLGSPDSVSGLIKGQASTGRKPTNRRLMGDKVE